MNVHKVIIHELIKEQRRTEANEYLSNHVYTVNQDTFDLVDKLNKTFIRDSITYAIFKSEEGDNFPNYFSRYTQTDKVDNDFVQFTRLAILNLKQIIRPVIFASGGYFVFSEYTDNDTLYLSVFLIRDEKGIVFRKNIKDGGFEINSVSHLNTNKLAMGCRINLNKYNAQDGKYLALIKNNQADISDYFNLWISTDQPDSSTEYTETLYQIISNVDVPVDPESGTSYLIDEFRKQVHDYIKNRPNKIVNISDMSNYFYQDSNYLSLFAEQNNYIIDSEFKVDGRKLQKFWRLEVNSDGIQLRFSRGDLNTKVRISEENPDIILIESKRFANKLKREAENEMR
jgi:Nucleoid-associated protein